MVKEISKKIFNTVSIIIISLIALVLIFDSFYTIRSDERGILDTFGKVNQTPLQAGLGFKIPFVQGIQKMDIRTIKYEADASSASNNMQDVFAKITVNYHIDASKVVDIYVNVGTDYEKKLIQPIVQESVKAITAKFTAEELITKRELAKGQISSMIKDRLSERNIIVEDVSITNFSFSKEFNTAIEAKSIAKQTIEKAEADLKRIEVEKQQRIIQSEAEMQSKKNNADAEAYIIKVNADAQAYQLKLIREELEKNSDLLQYKYIEKWNGAMPTYYGGSGLLQMLEVK